MKPVVVALLRRAEGMRAESEPADWAIVLAQTAIQVSKHVDLDELVTVMRPLLQTEADLGAFDKVLRRLRRGGIKKRSARKIYRLRTLAEKAPIDLEPYREALIAAGGKETNPAIRMALADIAAACHGIMASSAIAGYDHPSEAIHHYRVALSAAALLLDSIDRLKEGEVGLRDLFSQPPIKVWMPHKWVDMTSLLQSYALADVRRAKELAAAARRQRLHDRRERMIDAALQGGQTTEAMDRGPGVGDPGGAPGLDDGAPAGRESPGGAAGGS